MPTPATFAAKRPDKPAIIMGAGETVVTYGALEHKSNQSAQVLRELGLRTGEVLGVCVENGPEFFYVVCGARRAGLLVVPISTKLTAAEVAFIVGDSGAKALVVSQNIEAAPDALVAAGVGAPILTTGFALAGFEAFDAATARAPAAPIGDEAAGGEMLYSSGTTGRPKGICYKAQGDVAGASDAAVGVLKRMGLTEASVYLSPAPLYHSAPYAWAMASLTVGATVVVMEHFDPELALALIQRYRVDISQWVPTHFVRMLKLPDAVRTSFNVSSLKLAVHAAAPCPVAVKNAMIDWWGPVLLEYFGSSEQTILTIINSEEWLSHRGSVGKCVAGALHICDETGQELPVGEVGQIYADGGAQFSYLNDADKTASAHSPQGWTTVGDIGRLDEEGYLYLTDRKSFMIITGGVNVYPQEIEDRLIAHPDVADAAVIGMPDEDLGEVVVAVVQPAEADCYDDGFAERLRVWMRQSLSGVKVPKHILFRRQLPRLPTGKMAKHVLRRELQTEWGTAPQY